MPLFTEDLGVNTNGSFSTVTPDPGFGSIANDALYITGKTLGREGGGGPTQTDRDREGLAPYIKRLNRVDEYEKAGAYQSGQGNVERQKIMRELAVQFPDKVNDVATIVGINSGVNLSEVSAAEQFKEDPETAIQLQVNKYLTENPGMAALAASYSVQLNGSVDPALVYGYTQGILAQEKQIEIEAKAQQNQEFVKEKAVAFLSNIGTQALTGLNYITPDLVNASDTSFVEGVTARDQLYALGLRVREEAQRSAFRMGVGELSESQLNIISLPVDNMRKLFEKRFGDKTIDEFAPYAAAKSNTEVAKIIEGLGLAVTNENMMAIAAIAYSADENKITEEGLALARKTLGESASKLEAIAAIDPRFNIDVDARINAVSTFIDKSLLEKGNTANAYQFVLDNVNSVAEYAIGSKNEITRAEARDTAFSTMSGVLAKAQDMGGPSMDKASLEKLFPAENSGFGKIMQETAARDAQGRPVSENHRAVMRGFTEVFESSRQWRVAQIERAVGDGSTTTITKDRFGSTMAVIKVAPGTALANILESQGKPLLVNSNELKEMAAKEKLNRRTSLDEALPFSGSDISAATPAGDLYAQIRPHLDVITLLDDKATQYGLTGLESTNFNRPADRGRSAQKKGNTMDFEDEVAQVLFPHIERWEGLELEAYQDSVGVWTIGYGHTGDVKEGDTISKEEAMDLYLEDSAEARSVVEAETEGLNLSTNQKAALVSFTYNVGTGAFKGSTLLKKLKAGDTEGAAEEFKKWNKGTIKGKKVEIAGLTNRREAEAELFLSA